MRRRDANPVPTFLVIDQPSQVYFPSDTFKGLEEGVENAAVQEARGEDLKRTRHIFEMLSAVCKGLSQLQVIVLEHADRSTWGDVVNVRQAANWRDENPMADAI